MLKIEALNCAVIFLPDDYPLLFPFGAEVNILADVSLPCERGAIVTSTILFTTGG
jgi:hypothetical protein